MKLIFTFCLLMYFAPALAQNKISIAVGGGAAYTFHRAFNYDDGVNLIETGNKKGPVGFTYALDLKLEKSKITWGVQYNVREFNERVNRTGFLGAYVDTIYYPQLHEYRIKGNLYHKEYSINFYAEKNLVKNKKGLFAVGAGPSFFWERNQYIGAQSGVTPGSPFNVSTFSYDMYQTGEFGIYSFINAEKKLKNRYSIGLKFDFCYLFTVWSAENIGLFPYLKVEL